MCEQANIKNSQGGVKETQISYESLHVLYMTEKKGQGPDNFFNKKRMEWIMLASIPHFLNFFILSIL